MRNLLKSKLKSIALVALLALPLSVGGSIAQENPQANPWPAAAPAKPFNLPTVNRSQLDNGLTAIYVPFGIVPKVTVQVRIQTGNLNEKGLVWIADLAADMLKEGANGISGSDLALKAAEMGGDISISTSSNTTTLTLSVLFEHGKAAVGLLADLVMRPDFPEAEFDRLKQGYIRNLSVSKTQPRSLASEAFFAELYPDHPYGVIFPTEVALNGYTLDDAKAYYETNFGAKRTDIYVVGQFNDGEMRVAINTAFGNWAPGPEVLTLDPVAKTERLVKVIDREGSAQSTIYLGLPTLLVPDPDYTKMDVMNTLLGGAFGSRITRNIREDKGYTYSPRSSLTGNVGSRYWAEVADVTSENTGDSVREITWEIKNLQDNAPDAAELNGIKNYMAGIFVLRNGSRGGIINQLGFVKLHGLDDTYLSGYTDRVMAITAADVQNMAKTHLDLDMMTLVVVGIEADVKEQLAKIGWK
jgi:predicted Zn-dependent peptidase